MARFQNVKLEESGRSRHETDIYKALSTIIKSLDFILTAIFKAYTHVEEH